MVLEDLLINLVILCDFESSWQINNKQIIE